MKTLQLFFGFLSFGVGICTIVKAETGTQISFGVIAMCAGSFNLCLSLAVQP